MRISDWSSDGCSSDLAHCGDVRLRSGPRSGGRREPLPAVRAAMSPLDSFDDIMAWSDPAMAIVTTTDGRERAGCLIGFHAQSGMAPSGLSIRLAKRWEERWGGTGGVHKCKKRG